MAFYFLVPVKKIQQEGQMCGKDQMGNDYGECAGGLTCDLMMTPSMNAGLCKRIIQEVAKKGNMMTPCLDDHKKNFVNIYMVYYSSQMLKYYCI